MAVFRVERNKGYTVMSNHHLRNKELSLKAKGLLSQMLSLPEDWDYTLKGLCDTGERAGENGRRALYGNAGEMPRAYGAAQKRRADRGRRKAALACLSNLYPSFPLDIPHSSFPCFPCRGRRRTSHSPGTACRSCSVCRNSSFCWNCIYGGLQSSPRKK